MKARTARPDRAPEAHKRVTEPGHVGVNRSLLDLQRAAGNRAVVRTLAGSSHGVTLSARGVGLVQRFGGYYLVCEPTDPGAVLVENDTVVPARDYRTVNVKPPNAVKAPAQPFSFWNLYEVPKTSTPVPPVASQTAAEDQDEVVDEFATTEEDVREKKVPTTGPSQSNQGSTKKAVPPPKKEKKAATAQSTPTTKDASPAAVASGSKPEQPAEELWKTELRQIAKKQGWTKEAVAGQIKGCEEGLRDKAASLEKKLTELAGVWLAELETVAPFLSLAERQQRFRDNVPAFDGHYASLLSNLALYAIVWGNVKGLSITVKITRPSRQRSLPKDSPQCSR